MPEIAEYIVVNVEQPDKLQATLNAYLKNGYMLHSVIVIPGVGLRAIMFMMKLG